jgi:protein tyrosine phosphatase (PTP) superfamily phosphohydrolase (DUF442 family)
LPFRASSRRRAFLVLVALAVAAASVYLWRFQIFRLQPVTAGVYRSRQPSANELRRAIDRMDVKTIVNLRGWNPKREWYRAEERVAHESGVALVNLPFETFDWPPRIETQRFVRAISAAERPVLIHCATGVDRSGWAAAVVRILAGASLDEALEEMSRRRGHFCRIQRCPLHQFFSMYERWLKEEGLQHDAATFRRWALEEYAPVPYDAEIHLTRKAPPAVAPGQQVDLRALVTNQSPERWPAPVETHRGIRLGARLLGPFERLPENPVDLFRLPRAPARDLFRDNGFVGSWQPGVAREVEVTFDAPEQQGLYIVQVDMVDELVHWFSDLGREGVVFPLRVRQ